MTTSYTRVNPYQYNTAAVTGDWNDRHKSSRIKENIWQHSAIGNIEDFLSNVQWDDLGGNSSRLDNLTSWNQDRMTEIGSLIDWNDDRIEEIQGINTRTDANTANLRALKTRIDNWNTTTDVGDVVGLDDTLKNLLADYTKTADLPADQDLSDYMKTTDFNTRMRNNLDTLGATLRGEWGRDIQTLDLDSVRDSISDVGGDLTQLTNRFAGINTDVDYLNSLDLGGLENRITSNRQGDLTNLRDIIESGRGEDLRNLQDTMGRDRAADLLDLRQKIADDRLTETEALAGNLRHEFGDQVFDLSDTFDRRLEIYKRL